MKTITVECSKPYEVKIGENILENCGEIIRKTTKALRAMIITDDIVDGFYSDIVENSLKENGFFISKFVFPYGEGSKKIDTVMNIYSALCENNFGRTDIVVALGGGVVGDTAGYAAKTFMRGLDFVQIPTTVLSAVDSSVGGKTGINIKEGKNLVGAFHQPLVVVCDINTFKTLSEETYSDGVCEAIKTGLIYDKSLFELIYNKDFSENALEIVSRCVKIKAEVVKNDEFETGLRAILNFGHTLGHAIEKATEFKITHGSAVSVGMVIITKAAEKNGLSPKGTADIIESCLKKYNLPTSTEFDLKIISEYALGDKKRDGNSIKIIILEALGKAKIIKMTTEEFLKFLQA